VQDGLLDILAPDQITSFRDHLAGPLETEAAEALRKVETTGKLDEADKAVLLTVLNKLAESRGAADV